MFVYFKFCRYERCFIITGLELPNGTQDRDDRQAELLTAVKAFLLKLDPDLSQHKLTYVRVIKSPAPSVLEVECELVSG